MAAAKYDPAAKKTYKVGHIPENARRRRIVTEIRRPEPAACLVLVEGEEVELTNEEYRILLNQDSGPLIPRDLLTEVVKKAPAPVESDLKAKK